MARTRGRGDAGGALWLLGAAVLAAPLLVFVAAFGTRYGWWSRDIGYDLLALGVGRWLALAGLAAGLLALLIGLRQPRRYGLLGAVLLLVGGGFAVATWMQHQRLTADAPGDVSTNPQEPPAFSETLLTARGAPVGVASSACPGVAAVPRQLAAPDVAEALRRAGFRVVGAGAFRVEGTHSGYWFGFDHDVTVRIRPARTDVRIAARSGKPQGDQACALLAEATAELAKAP